jgi:hypothetical protein
MHQVPCVRKRCYDGYTYNASVRHCVDTGYDDNDFWKPNFEVDNRLEKHGIRKNSLEETA